MIVSPDSSVNFGPPSSTTGSHHHQSVQVRECTQSQTPYKPMQPETRVITYPTQYPHIVVSNHKPSIMRAPSPQPNPSQVLAPPPPTMHHHLQHQNQHIQQQQHHQIQQHHQHHQQHQQQDYHKTYPVMEPTVASSVKGEPELNIGKHCVMLLHPCMYACMPCNDFLVQHNT